MPRFRPFSSPLFQIQAYTRFLTGNAISAIGFGMQFIASSWITLELTGRGSSVAWLLVFHALPGLLFGPFAGVLVDRLDQRKLAAFTDLARALVVFLIVLLHALGQLEVWHLFLMEFLLATGDVLFRPATLTLVRKVVPPPLLLDANILTRIWVQLGMILGAGLGGVVLAGASPMWAMGVNGVSFLVSALFLLSIRLPRLVGERVALTPTQFVTDLKDGLRYIRENPSIVLPYVIICIIWTTPQTLNTLLPVFAKDELKVGSIGFGLIDAGWAIGSVVGGLLLSRIAQKLGRPRMMVLWVFLLSLCMLLQSQAWNLTSAMVVTVLMGFFVGINIVLQTEAQENTRVEFQGRVQSTFNTLYSVLLLGIYVGMGHLAENQGPRLGFLLQGVLLVLAGLLTLWRFGSAARQKVAGVSKQA